MQQVKLFFTSFFLLVSFFAKAQKVDSMFVHLYTDSLKKGTFNYINVDGLLADGNWRPLDTNHVEFKCSAGKFHGNQLWVDPDFEGDKISIDAIFRQDRTQHKQFEMYIKRQMDPAQLPDENEILKQKTKKKNN
jgi:hypothetical protein